MNKCNEVLAALAVVGVDAAKVVFDDINKRFKAATKLGSPERIYDFYALARRLYHYAMAVGENQKKGKSSPPKPAYEEIADRYQSFIESDSAKPFADIWAVIEPDDLRRFCTLESRRQGSGTARFYASLATFAMYLESLDDDMDIVNCATPSSEHSLIDRLHRGICSALNEAARKKGLEPLFPKIRPPSARINPEVYVEFDYQEENMRRLSSFLERLIVDTDGHAHFYVYRPRKRHPAQLMKSFLAIKEHEPPSWESSRKNYQFTHVYQPPKDIASTSQKLAMGRIVPMENGIYLVGGQRRNSSRPAPGSVPERAVFHSLHLLYIPWGEISEERSVLYGMGLLSNNDGVLLATRLALIPTAVSKGDQANLGAVHISKLIADLQNNMNTEPQGTIFPLSDPSADISSIAGHVVDFCNNEPSGLAGWDIDTVFKSNETNKTLTKSMIDHELNSLFGSSGSPKYVSDDGQFFEFWKSLRFGPIVVND